MRQKKILEKKRSPFVAMRQMKQLKLMLLTIVSKISEALTGSIMLPGGERALMKRYYHDMKEIGQSEDLDVLAIYFMSEQSKFTTGQGSGI